MAICRRASRSIDAPASLPRSQTSGGDAQTCEPAAAMRGHTGRRQRYAGTLQRAEKPCQRRGARNQREPRGQCNGRPEGKRMGVAAWLPGAGFSGRQSGGVRSGAAGTDGLIGFGGGGSVLRSGRVAGLGNGAGLGNLYALGTLNALSGLGGGTHSRPVRRQPEHHAHATCHHQVECAGHAP